MRVRRWSRNVMRVTLRSKAAPQSFAVSIWLTVAIILVNLLDYASTIVALKLGAHEQNPLASFFYNSWSDLGLLGFKIVGTFLVILVAFKNQKIAWLCLYLTTAVVLNNLLVIFYLL